MSKTLYGGCQCGSIRFSAKSLLDNPHVCHCRMCQKASGNFFSALVGVPLNDFTWTRGNPHVFRSSEFVERGFCHKCGTPLFFKHDKNAHISMTIGSFDEPKDIPLEFQLGMESRLPQVDQLAHLKDYGSTEQNDPDGSTGIKDTNRQHPDHETTEWPVP
ncbi:GFA family protein [Saccharospirillum mangrovi]|uniref:GFA family protein n=1 Tax=Saccharospirillum mangrovi TaxID=2161747 RepID=UPI000D3CD8C8|nr:GFA family protein [Saccharospirillum mangrovi]